MIHAQTTATTEAPIGPATPIGAPSPESPAAPGAPLAPALVAPAVAPIGVIQGGTPVPSMPPAPTINDKAPDGGPIAPSEEVFTAPDNQPVGEPTDVAPDTPVNVPPIDAPAIAPIDAPTITNIAPDGAPVAPINAPSPLPPTSPVGGPENNGGNFFGGNGAIVKNDDSDQQKKLWIATVFLVLFGFGLYCVVKQRRARKAYAQAQMGDLELQGYDLSPNGSGGSAGYTDDVADHEKNKTNLNQSVGDNNPMEYRHGEIM